MLMFGAAKQSLLILFDWIIDEQAVTTPKNTML